MSIFTNVIKKTKRKVVFIGLDNSGKSTIISFLQEGKFKEQAPTMGKRNYSINIKGTTISIIDMGGQEDFRQLWTGELKNAKCVIFVIDIASKERYTEARKEFDKIVPYIKEYGLQLLIFANKYDLAPDVDIISIMNIFELESLDQFEIMKISAKTGYGMVEAFSKFYSILTGQKMVTRKRFAEALTICNIEGIPLVTEIQQENEDKIESIKNEFRDAINKFNSEILEENNEKWITRETIDFELGSRTLKPSTAI